MALINSIENLGAIIGSYLIIALYIAVVVKIFQIVQNIGGGKGGSTRSGSTKPGSTSTTTGPDGKPSKDKGDKGPSSRDKAKEDYDEAKKNPGKISFKIRNVDDQPVKGALVELWPAKTKVLFKKLGRYGAHFKDHTNADGIVPTNGEEWEIPSVMHKIRVTYKLKKTETYLKKREGQFVRKMFAELLHSNNLVVKSDILIKAEDMGQKTMQLPFTAEGKTGFQPIIKDVDHDNDGKLILKGEVQRG